MILLKKLILDSGVDILKMSTAEKLCKIFKSIQEKTGFTFTFEDSKLIILESLQNIQQRPSLAKYKKMLIARFKKKKIPVEKN